MQQKLRRLPFAVSDVVFCRIKEKIDASPWLSPIVVTQRKNSPRIRKAIVTDNYPNPHMEELFSELREANIFSTIDLANAYNQVLLHKESRDLTAFITLDGLFRYKPVYYGLASAFQKMMSIVLQGLPGVQAYLDDIIVYSASLADHKTHLKALLFRLQEAGLRLNT